ncbi:hypothetical protein GMA10_12630 [Kocuria koreensis]|jgi:hypothetical protein|uniref:Uncharacterized protein n=1 Tax=Rothia koreensis TaxID=592378 RepID=A0A7M3SW78_9MICC|nr:hypothetical protein [Rothia koreensis]MUN56043.1 hypothetical protein [Rothia koreensis]
MRLERTGIVQRGVLLSVLRPEQQYAGTPTSSLLRIIRAEALTTAQTHARTAVCSEIISDTCIVIAGELFYRHGAWMAAEALYTYWVEYNQHLGQHGAHSVADEEFSTVIGPLLGVRLVDHQVCAILDELHRLQHPDSARRTDDTLLCT